MEAQRFILWAPVLMTAGIAAWFTGDVQPSVWASALMLLASAGIWVAAARREVTGVRIAAKAVTFFALGIFLIALRASVVAAPVVPAGLGTVTVTGVLEETEVRERDRRHLIRVETISRLSAQETPAKVRVIWRGDPGQARPGDTVRLPASLAPPPGPTHPGGYDFSRGMAFEKIGAVGFSYSAPQVVRRGGSGFRAEVEALRIGIADRVERKIGGAEGGVAAALITGKRARIPEERVADLRDAGLAHLLAISGLHMGLVCGFLFWSARFLLSRSETLALHTPIKKLAAAAALLGGLAYLFLSGGAWSAQRAFIMAGVVFAAILFDRRGISLRNVAIAALIIISLRPEAVMSPGFQMSFAAVTTLIAAFSFIEERWPRGEDRSTLTKVTTFFGGLTMTSLIAGMATAPFAIFHFGRFASFGLLGNLLAMPIVTIAVMPALVLSMFLMPVGLDGPVLFLVGKGIGLVLAIAGWTADLPGAVKLFPQLAGSGLAAACGGLVILTLSAAPWRLAGAGIAALALPLGMATTEPDILVSRDLRNVAVRTDGEATFALLSKRRDRFAVESWLTASGEEPDVKAQTTIEGCRNGPCYAETTTGEEVAIIERREQLTEACSRAGIIILRARLPDGGRRSCPALVLAQRDDGTHPAASLTAEDGTWRLRLAGE